MLHDALLISSSVIVSNVCCPVCCVEQAEYDIVTIGLQTRLDEKEYKSREIADSFKDFKREV